MGRMGAIDQRDNAASWITVEARKDTRDPDEVNSPFVWLIDELQECLPEELRRHDHSRDGLAAAIHRARKSNWWPVLLPPSIRAKYASLLESPQQGRRGSKGSRRDLGRIESGGASVLGVL